MTKKVDLVIDLQFGSTGKGLLCGYLANENAYDTVISANMPNAGHTYMPDALHKYVFKCLPTSCVGKSVERVMIGPGSVFTLDQLRKELDFMRNGSRLYIHERAVIMQPHHMEEEKKRLNHISSTMQGSAAAMIEKIWRSGSKITAKDVLPGTYYQPCVISTNTWLEILENEAKMVLAEGSQGYSLGINTSFYPYTTSRDCTPAAFLSAMSIPIPMLHLVYGSARTYPIRVGNTQDGHSGLGYHDQEEISWESLGVTPETTTVTGRVRRVFTFSKAQIREAIKMCGPDAVFLNFCNYAKSKDELNDIVSTITAAGSSVWWTGWGPTHQDVRRFPHISRSYKIDRDMGGYGVAGPHSD